MFIKVYVAAFDELCQMEVNDDAKIPESVEISLMPFPELKLRPRKLSEWPEMQEEVS
jgi:hypothetical protein